MSDPKESRYIFDTQVPLPEDLSLDGKFKQYADRVGLVDPEKAFEDFKRHAREKGLMYRDWSLGWGQWLMEQKTHPSIGERRRIPLSPLRSDSPEKNPESVPDPPSPSSSGLSPQGAGNEAIVPPSSPQQSLEEISPPQLSSSGEIRSVTPLDKEFHQVIGKDFPEISVSENPKGVHPSLLQTPSPSPQEPTPSSAKNPRRRRNALPSASGESPAPMDPLETLPRKKNSTHDFSPLDLDAIETRLNAATPGPWRACRGGKCSCNQIWSLTVDVPVAEVIRGEWGDPGLPYGEIPDEAATANARLMAHAPEDLRALIDRIRDLESQLNEAHSMKGTRDNAS